MREVDYAEAVKMSERPSRIALAVSFDEANSRCDIIVLGWKMRTSIKPPMVAISVGKTRYSHELILREKEFVLAFPGEDIAREVLMCGTVSGRDADKFADTGLTPAASKHIRPCLISECPVNYECRLSGTLDTGDHTVFAGEILTSYVSGGEKILLSASGGGGYNKLLDEKGYSFAVVK